MRSRILEREQCGVADQQRGIGVGEHGERIGCGRDELRISPNEFAKEKLCVGE